MGSITEARQIRELIQQPQRRILKACDLSFCASCMCSACVRVSVAVRSYVSRVDTESAKDQPAMTDWWRLPSCWSFFCGELVHLCVLVRVDL